MAAKRRRNNQRQRPLCPVVPTVQLLGVVHALSNKVNQCTWDARTLKERRRLFGGHPDNDYIEDRQADIFGGHTTPLSSLSIGRHKDGKLRVLAWGSHGAIFLGFFPIPVKVMPA